MSVSVMFRSFNPRTHEGCDFPKYRSNHTILVSIHAPTRGATRVSPARRSCQRVSIHAPTRGATLICIVHFAGTLVSIHAPTRGATYNASTAAKFFKVSIHAPTRGATQLWKYFNTQVLFQSTHPRGVRLGILAHLLSGLVFQSTHPRGVRHLKEIILLHTDSFNPRTHEGCDIIRLLISVNAGKFQSTHPRGVRLLRATNLHAH